MSTWQNRGGSESSCDFRDAGLLGLNPAFHKFFHIALMLLKYRRNSGKAWVGISHKPYTTFYQLCNILHRLIKKRLLFSKNRDKDKESLKLPNFAPIIHTWKSGSILLLLRGIRTKVPTILDILFYLKGCSGKKVLLSGICTSGWRATPIKWVIIMDWVARI